MRDHGRERESKHSAASPSSPSSAAHETRTPQQQAAERVAHFRATVEHVASEADQLRSNSVLADWREEKTKIEKRRQGLLLARSQREQDAAVAEHVRADFDAATAGLDRIAETLQSCHEPRARRPVAGEIDIEPAIIARTASPEQLLAWASQLGAGERSALSERLAAISTGAHAADRDELAIALANHLAVTGLYRSFRGVLADPVRFVAKPRAEAVAIEVQTESVDSLVSRALDADDVEAALETVFATFDSSRREAFAKRLDTYRPGFGDSLAARIKRLDRTPRLLEVLGSLRSGARSEQGKSEVAESAVAAADAPLPHADKIQQSFGKHDISGIRAQVGGPAADASHELGAVAFATRGQVAFAAAPDLHTAAHEAAHVIQQRQGVALKGDLDEPGDAYEQHADAVAARVERGESAEALLDQLAGSGGGGAAVQRKTGGKPSERSSDEPAVVHAD
ncbi:MAG TPA: DUF4157 domain-containing protein, partial [Kofleriaceae bacterium]|nr:DUF4157 domain-containing protein [Kofleriaceae bacterium]